MSDAGEDHWFRVALHDTDAAGVLFFAHLLRHAHDAYEAAMRHLGWPLDQLIRAGELGLPLVHAEADFQRPLRHGDQVRVGLAVEAVASQRFTLGYRFWRGEQQVATARTLHVAIDPTSGRSRPLPPALSAALARLSGIGSEP